MNAPMLNCVLGAPPSVLVASLKRPERPHPQGPGLPPLCLGGPGQLRHGDRVLQWEQQGDSCGRYAEQWLRSRASARPAEAPVSRWGGSRAAGPPSSLVSGVSPEQCVQQNYLSHRCAFKFSVKEASWFS